MNMKRTFMPWNKIDYNEVRFTLGQDRAGKTAIGMHVGALMGDLGMVTPACVTNWPRVTGDGNFGTMWGPNDITKAKFSLDLTDQEINGESNPSYEDWGYVLEQIDDKLLDFVQHNQLKILGRKNLSRDEVKMLQIRTVRPKYDKMTGQHMGFSVQMTSAKYVWDGMGGKVARKINICDYQGNVLKEGQVSPGDVVAATMYANQVYTGVGGDKFGIHWGVEDVAVVCQRSKMAQRVMIDEFSSVSGYAFAQEYTAPMAYVTPSDEPQFSDP